MATSLIIKNKLGQPLTPGRSTKQLEIAVFFGFRRGEGEEDFRCIRCGKLLFQYDSQARLIMIPAEVPKTTGIKKILCTRCRAFYYLL